MMNCQSSICIAEFLHTVGCAPRGSTRPVSRLFLRTREIFSILLYMKQYCKQKLCLRSLVPMSKGWPCLNQKTNSQTSPCASSPTSIIHTSWIIIQSKGTMNFSDHIHRSGRATMCMKVAKLRFWCPAGVEWLRPMEGKCSPLRSSDRLMMDHALS